MYKSWIALPLAVTLLSPELAMAREERIPASCVYDGTKSLPRDELSALVKSGYQAKDGKAKSVMAKVGMSASDCTTKNGWSAKRKDAAVHYLTGRVLREDAIYRGKAVGLTAEIFDGLVAKLSPADHTGFATGQATAAMNNALVPQLQAAGIKIDTMAPADRGAFAEMLDQGITGSVIEADSIAAFNAH